MVKSTTLDSFQASLAEQVEQPAQYATFEDMHAAIRDGLTAENPLGEIVGRVRRMANEQGIEVGEIEIRDLADRIHASLQDAPEAAPTPNPLAALAQRMVRERPAGDGHVGDPFEGMALDVDPADAFGLVQANVTAWLEERDRWASPIEIKHQAERLMAEAQTVRPGPVKSATYTVAPDGSVGDYTPLEAERELPGMPGHPEAPAAEPVDPGRIWEPSVWGKVVNPDHKATLIFPIPQTSKFDGQLLAAHDLDDMVDMLVRTVRPLQTLSPLVISWYWKLKGGRSRGKPVLIRVREADKTLAYEKSLDVVVHLSADHLRKMKASSLFIERQVFDALARIDPAGPKVMPDDEWARLPGRWRYGWLGPEERLYAGLVNQIDGGHEDDTTVDVDAVTVVASGAVFDEGDGSDSFASDEEPKAEDLPSEGVLIHPDGTPFTAEEIAAQEAAELRDDPAEFDDDDSELPE